ncbi:MAG: transformer 2 beta, partial [Marteilia pararefringens]
MTQRYHADSRSRSRSRSSTKSADSRSSNFSDRRSYKRARSPRRENPRPAACLGIFNLHPMATERDLQDVFGAERYGEIRDIKVIRDHDTGKSKCYGFVYYVNVKDAILAKEELNNTEMRHKIIRVDYSYSKEKGGSGGAPRNVERQRSPPRSDYFRDRPRNRSRSPPARSHPSRRNARYSRSMSPRPAYRSRNHSRSPNVP